MRLGVGCDGEGRMGKAFCNLSSWISQFLLLRGVSLASTAVNLWSLCISVCGWMLVCVYL